MVRLVVLVVVVFGAFAALQVVQREFLPRTYPLRLLVVGDDIGDTIYAAPVLEHFQVEVVVPGLDGPPIVLGDAGAQAKVTLEGSKRYGPVEENGVQAFLVARVDSPAPFRQQLGRFTPGEQGREIVVELTIDDVERMERERVGTTFEVIDPDGRPVPGLVSSSFSLSDLGGGRYELQVDLDQAFVELQNAEPLQVRVEGAPNLHSIDIDPTWLLGAPREARVVRAQPEVDGTVPLPVIASVTPRRIPRSARTGRVVVSGEDLLLVASARLVRGSTSLPLRVERQRDASFEFELPDGLSLGTWSLELDADRASAPVRVDDALEVYAEFQLQRPAPMAEIAHGTPIDVQWTAPGGTGNVKIEIESVDSGVRWPVYEGSLGREAARFPETSSDSRVAPLAPGAYRVVLALPASIGGEVVTRSFTVLDPPAVTVIVQFTRNGRAFTAYDEVTVNGLEVELDKLRRSFRVILPAGRHELAVKVNSRWQQFQFETNGTADEKLSIALDR